MVSEYLLHRQVKENLKHKYHIGLFSFCFAKHMKTKCCCCQQAWILPSFLQTGKASYCVGFLTSDFPPHGLSHLLRSEVYGFFRGKKKKKVHFSRNLISSCAFAKGRIISISRLKCGIVSGLELRVCTVPKKPSGTCVRSSWVGGITWGYTLYGWVGHPSERLQLPKAVSLSAPPGPTAAHP